MIQNATRPESTPRGYVDLVTIGFGAAVVMWAIGYYGRLPGALAPTGLLLGLLVLCLLLAGAVAARFTGRGAVGAGAVGAIAGVLNLLVLGSLISRPDASELIPSAVLWIPGFVLTSLLLSLAGAYCARWLPPALRRTTIGPQHLTWVVIAATLVLISAGGAVTGYQAGLAVPDWPNSYGYNMFLYPMARMTGGIYFEHAHRLLGALVGLATVALCACVFLCEKSGWRRALAGVAVMLVIAQGVMGGLRVTGRLTTSVAPEDLAPNLTLAVIHGVTAQVFLALLALLAATLSPAWRSAERVERRSAATDAALGGLSLALIITQLVFGALLRHYSWGLHLHLTLAFVVLLVVGAYAFRCWGLYEGVAPLPSLGGILILILAAQLALGLLALLATMSEEQLGATRSWHVVVTTLHQTLGAIVLATTTLLVTWHVRVVGAPGAATAPTPAG